MSLRVVVYAEGAGELRGGASLPMTPGHPLADEQLGAAHLLVRRCLSVVRKLPEPAIRFEAPLRTSRGREARGSDLIHPQTLRQLLTWARPQLRPQLAVVLFDCDDQHDRLHKLGQETAQLAVSRVLAMPVQEFEAWLIADTAAVTSAVRANVAQAAAPEQMRPGEAKELLASWLAGEAHRTGELRRQIAATLDLEAVEKRCPSFAEFLKALRSLTI